MDTEKKTEDAKVMIMVTAQEWNEKTSKINEILEAVKSFADKQTEYLTPAEVCQMLKIGRNTYERFWRTGILKTCNIAGSKRKYVKRTEVLHLLNTGNY
jgi:hypothetical protein